MAIKLHSPCVSLTKQPFCAGILLKWWFNPNSTSFSLPSMTHIQGGIAFVTIKGALKVFYKQQQFLRQAHRKIQDFPDENGPWDDEDDDDDEKMQSHPQGELALVSDGIWSLSLLWEQGSWWVGNRRVMVNVSSKGELSPAEIWL